MDPGSSLGFSLKDVKWSAVAVPLDLLVSTYRLPQIARLDSGAWGGRRGRAGSGRSHQRRGRPRGSGVGSAAGPGLTAERNATGCGELLAARCQPRLERCERRAGVVARCCSRAEGGGNISRRSRAHRLSPLAWKAAEL